MANKDTQNTELQLTFTSEVTDNRLIKACNKVHKKMESINKGYLDIIGDFQYIIDCKAWEFTSDYKNKYEFFAQLFGMSKGTVSNLENIYKRFGINDGESYKLSAEAEGMSIRQMLATIKAEKDALLEVSEEDEALTESDSTESESEATDSEESTAESNDGIVNFDFTVGADWSIADLLDDLLDQLTNANIEELKAGTHVTLKIN